MKYTHKNGWHATIKDGYCRLMNDNKTVEFGTPRGVITEQTLIDFGFEKEEDVYKQCIDEMMPHPVTFDTCIQADAWHTRKKAMLGILKKYFSTNDGE